MSKYPSVRKIGIIGNIGNGNLGDEATFAAVIQNIIVRYPDAQIYGFSDNPQDTITRHKIPVFALRRLDQHFQSDNLRIGSESNVQKSHKRKILYENIKTILRKLPLLYNLLKATRNMFSYICRFLAELKFITKYISKLKTTDLFIIPGSGHLSDHFGGASNYPYTLFKWALISKFSNTKLAFMSVGAGPLYSSLSRRLIKYSLLLSSYRSFRDEASRRLIQEIIGKNEDPIYPNLAHSLQIKNNPHLPYANKPQRIVGINVFPHYDYRYWPESDPSKYQTYINKIACFAVWLIENEYQVFFFPTQIKADTRVIFDIMKLLKRNESFESEKGINKAHILTHEDLIKNLSIFDIVVATRFHGIIFSSLLHKPILAIANHHKMRAFMEDLGQSKYLVDINSFKTEDLIRLFIMLDLNKESIKNQIQMKVSEYRNKLDFQYNHIFDHLI